MSEEHFQEEAIKIKKEIFELHLKKATQQNVKPHLFKATRCRLAQLLTIRKQSQLERH